MNSEYKAHEALRFKLHKTELTSSLISEFDALMAKAELVDEAIALIDLLVKEHEAVNGDLRRGVERIVNAFLAKAQQTKSKE